MESTLYDIGFGVDNALVKLCPEKRLSLEDVKAFRKAIAHDYVYEMIYDNLPYFVPVGTYGSMPDFKDGMMANKTAFMLYTHLNFHIQHSIDQVIQIDILPAMASAKDITDDKEVGVQFTYSTKWIPTDIEFKDRMNRYFRTQNPNRDLEIQWFSVVNSLVLVIVLAGLVALIITRTLRNDYQRYLQLEDMDVEEQEEERGWKLLHADVFRYPPYPSVFAAVLGVGTQFLIATLVLLGVSLLGTFYPLKSSRGQMYTAGIALYALTGIVAGFTSATVYRKLGGEKWAWNAVLSSVLFFGPLFLLFAFLNSVAIAYNSIAALPATTIILLLSLWVFVIFPLTVVGAVIGKNMAKPFDSPTRTKQIPREVPPQPSSRHPIVQICISGFLALSASFIELHYVYDSLFAFRQYRLFGILALTFIVLVLVVACLAISLTYFQLSSEDYNWWWRAIFVGGAYGPFLYAYSIYYLRVRSQMFGFLQLSYYLGYTAISAYAFSLMFGAVGWFASFVFVRRLFSSIRSD